MTEAGNTGGGASASPPSPVSIRYALERLGPSRVQLSVKETTNVPLARALAKVQRDKEERFGLRRNAEMVHVARLPTTVVKAIAVAHGIELINVFGRKDWTPPSQAEMRRLERIIETDFPDLKATHKRFNLKRNSVAST